MVGAGARTAALGEADTPWPLSDGPAFGRVPHDWREALAARFERDLRRHVMDAWFPACVDNEAGGFFSDLDRRWRLAGPQHRMLEGQARQTRTAARLGRAFPSEPRWTQIALHGLHYLREVMHDKAEGGWYWMVDRSGQPMAGGTKHAHGTAYLMDAGLEVFRLTGAEEALELALTAFAWLQACLRDRDHGGYHGWATRDGRPIMTPDDVPAPELREPLGHGIGLKDINVHSDLLEAFTYLALTCPDEGVVSALGEVYEAITEHFVGPGGQMHYMISADWTPLPALEEYGYHLQTALRLPFAAPLVGRSASEALASSRLLVDHAVARGWLDGGAFAHAGPAAEPNDIEGTSIVVRKRSFWVQTEGLKILLLFALLDERPEHYRSLTDELVSFIDRHLIDHRHGGWLPLPLVDQPLRRRLRAGRLMAKGDLWKDASHEADLYLIGLRMLRGLAHSAALEAPATQATRKA
jgi:cellobiose epimerase